MAVTPQKRGSSGQSRSRKNTPEAIPLIYRIFLLYIEPLFALFGAIEAYFFPHAYLELTYPSSYVPTFTTTSTRIVLSQLANLYLLFAINEAIVLRSTNDLKVWRAVIIGLLIADLGHLWSVKEKGLWVYWHVWAWDVMDWGNVGFVYAGAASRICFLAGVGFT